MLSSAPVLQDANGDSCSLTSPSPLQDANCAYLRASKLHLHMNCHLWTTKPTLWLTRAFPYFLYTILLKCLTFHRFLEPVATCWSIFHVCAWAPVWCIDRPAAVYMNFSRKQPRPKSVPITPRLIPWSSLPPRSHCFMYISKKAGMLDHRCCFRTKDQPCSHPS